MMMIGGAELSSQCAAMANLENVVLWSLVEQREKSQPIRIYSWIGDNDDIDCVHNKS